MRLLGTAGSLSTERVEPKWERKALQISEPVKEFSGTTYVGTAETLAIMFQRGVHHMLQRMDGAPGNGQRPA